LFFSGRFFPLFALACDFVPAWAGVYLAYCRAPSNTRLCIVTNLHRAATPIGARPFVKRGFDFKEFYLWIIMHKIKLKGIAVLLKVDNIAYSQKTKPYLPTEVKRRWGP